MIDIFEAATGISSVIEEIIPGLNRGDREELLGQFYTCSARLQAALNEFDSACELLGKAIATLREGDQKRVEAWILLGQYRFRQKKFEEAEVACSEGLRGCAMNRRFKRAVGPLLNLAHVQAKTRSESIALTTYAHVINLSAQVNTVLTACVAWGAIGRIFFITRDGLT